jgi:hypothetical protein
VEEFRDFKSPSREEFYSQTLEKQSNPVAFSDGWEPFGQHFPKLRQFCAGIATVVPGTSTVESDFRVLNWECDEFRSSLTDFSLESVMQCKQFRQLQSMKHSVSLTINDARPGKTHPFTEPAHIGPYWAFEIGPYWSQYGEYGHYHIRRSLVMTTPY